MHTSQPITSGGSIAATAIFYGKNITAFKVLYYV